MPYLGIFGLGFEKNYVIFETSTFEFAKIKSFMLKKKKEKQRTNSVLFGIFFNWNFKKLLSYLKSAPSNLPKCNVSCKPKKS